MNDKTKIIGCILIIVIIALIILMIHIRPNIPDTPIKADKLDEIISRGTLIIATDPESPPFSERIPGSVRNTSSFCHPAEYTIDEFTGFDVAVGVEIAKRMGLEPCFVSPAWTRIVAGDWADSWDISIGSMTITDERLERLYFTQPYNSAPVYIFVRQESTQYQNPEDLSGKRIGICAGCAQEGYLTGSLSLPGENITYRIVDAIPVAYNYESLGFADLATNSLAKLDAIIADAPIGMEMIRSGMPIRPLQDPVYHSYLAAAIDKKSTADPKSFVNRVSRIIQEMHDDGTLPTLAQIYLVDDYTLEAKRFNLESLRQFESEGE